MAFSVCSGLTAVYFNADSCTSMGSYSFSGNNYLAFYGCVNLATLAIGDNVTNIPAYAFYNYSGLTSELTIPNSVTTIGEGAFVDCSGLTGALTIHNSVTTIGRWTFLNCTGLTEVTIGNSVETIGESAFFYCIGLTEVTNLRTPPQSIDNSVFNDVTLRNITLKVPSSAVSAYQTADVWKNFKEVVGID